MINYEVEEYYLNNQPSIIRKKTVTATSAIEALRTVDHWKNFGGSFYKVHKKINGGLVSINDSVHAQNYDGTVGCAVIPATWKGSS